MTEIPTLAQLLKNAIDNRLLDAHTAIIGRVEKYDETRQLADVQPILKRAIKNAAGTINQEDLPLLVDVPVLFPRGGGFFIALPIQTGDYVQVIFNESSIEEFLTESPSTIAYNQRFTLQGAIAIPGIYPFSKTIQSAHKSNLVIGKDDGVKIHIDDDKIRLGSKKAEEALAIASRVKEELEKIKTAFNSHVHSYHNTPSVIKLGHIGNIATKKVVAE